VFRTLVLIPFLLFRILFLSLPLLPLLGPSRFAPVPPASPAALGVEFDNFACDTEDGAGGVGAGFDAGDEGPCDVEPFLFRAGWSGEEGGGEVDV
jgi:hypothetical protein